MSLSNDSQVQNSVEAELIERCLRKDEQAFEELVVRFQNMVYNLSFRFMGNSHEAEDLSQEVFFKVFKSLNQFRGASSLKTWIYRITTNMALNRLKFNKRRKQDKTVSLEKKFSEDAPALKESIADARPNQENRVHGKDIKFRLQEALNTVSEDQKAVIILRDIEGLSYEEIANALEINVGTVKSRLARGRLAIQEMMKDLL